jgi:hypothetical protein
MHGKKVGSVMGGLVNVKNTFMTGRAAEGDISVEALACQLRLRMRYVGRGTGRRASAGRQVADVQFTDCATSWQRR